MSTIANAVKADFEIVANLVRDNNGQQHAVPDIPAHIKFGKTVHYSSPDGDVRIEFLDNGSPFLDLNGSDKTEITSNDLPIKLSKKGKFTCRCFITPPGGAAIGWRPGDPKSGGNHVVQ
jgi:hypothetical protein